MWGLTTGGLTGGGLTGGGLTGTGAVRADTGARRKEERGEHRRRGLVLIVECTA